MFHFLFTYLFWFLSETFFLFIHNFPFVSLAFSFFSLHCHGFFSFISILQTLMCCVLVWLVSSLLSALFVDGFETFQWFFQWSQNSGDSEVWPDGRHTVRSSIGLNRNLLCTSICIFSSFLTMHMTVSLRGIVSYSVLLLLYFTQIYLLFTYN